MWEGCPLPTGEEVWRGGCASRNFFGISCKMKRFSAFLTLFLVTDLSSKGGHVPPVPPMATPVV